MSEIDQETRIDSTTVAARPVSQEEAEENRRGLALDLPGGSQKNTVTDPTTGQKVVLKWAPKNDRLAETPYEAQTGFKSRR